LPVPRFHTKEDVSVEAGKSVTLVDIPYGRGDLTLISFVSDSKKFKLYVQVDGERPEEFPDAETLNKAYMVTGYAKEQVYAHIYSDADTRYGVTVTFEMHFDRSLKVWVTNKDSATKTLVYGIAAIENFCEGEKEE